LKIVTSHWLDQVEPIIFFATLVATLFWLARLYPLRRAWLIESRQWSIDKDVGFFDEMSCNKTGESFSRWLHRNGYRRWLIMQGAIMLLMLFTFIWPVISKDYCSINKCKGHPVPVGKVSQ
jgi:hypothetical protein